jgi:hypothetical protein
MNSYNSYSEKQTETLVYKVNTPTLDNNAYQCYFIFYILTFFFSFTVLDSYVLDLYFSSKTVYVPVLEVVKVQMPTWLIVNGCVGISTFFQIFVYMVMGFYTDYISKGVYRTFRIIILCAFGFLVSWSVVGWLRFFRYPTTIDTVKNTFHIFMWIRLCFQSAFSIAGFSRMICILRN